MWIMMSLCQTEIWIWLRHLEFNDRTLDVQENIMCMKIQWRNTVESVNENDAVVPPGCNIMSFTFKEAPYSYPSSKHFHFHLVFLLCDISGSHWYVVSFGVQTKATVSCSRSSAAVSRPTLPECGLLYDHASLFSLVQQRTEKPWCMAVCPDCKSTGSSQSLQQFFLLSLALFSFTPCFSYFL